MQETTPNTPAETEATDPKLRYRCRHVFTEGHRCGSPSLRGQDLCYYHHASRREPSLAGHNGYFLMPRIDDRPAIQIALYDVLSRLSQFDIDPKRAGMLLYGLQIASSNLAKHEKSAANTEPVVEDIVSNPFFGDLAPIAEIPDPADTAGTQSPSVQTSGAPGSTASSSTLGLLPADNTAAPIRPVILSAAKNSRIQPEAPQTSEDTQPLAAEMWTPANDQLQATLSPLHTVPSPQPITLAAVQAVAAQPPAPAGTSNLEPSTIPPPVCPRQTPYNSE